MSITLEVWLIEAILIIVGAISVGALLVKIFDCCDCNKDKGK